MGTVFSLAAPDETQPALLDRAAGAAFDHLRHIDAVFSPFRPDSPVSRIRAGRLAPRDLAAHPQGREIREVLALCEALKRDTDGSFDAWAVGDPPGFDPCGAVKGWAAEHASALLVDHGLPRHSLNAGGDVRLRDGGQETPWRVGLTDPRGPGAVLGVITLREGAVATSGTAERGAHIWNPHTGRRVTGLLQVTVIGPRLDLADGYATAAMAMAETGSAAAHAWLDALAERCGYRSVTVDRAGRVRWSPGTAESEVA